MKNPKFSQEIQQIIDNFIKPTFEELELNWYPPDYYLQDHDTSEPMKEGLEVLFRVDRVTISTYRVISKTKIPRRTQYCTQDMIHTFPGTIKKNQFLTVRFDEKEPNTVEVELSNKLITGDSFIYILRPEEFKKIIPHLERINTIEFLKQGKRQYNKL